MARTVIHDEQGNAKWGDEDHLQVSQSRSFASNIFELLSEKVPTEFQLKIFELILNISIDHGPDTPSAVETIKAAKDSKTISESVANGILQINDSHGGAIEPCMKMFYEIRDLKAGGCDLGHEMRELVLEKKEKGEKIPGFGHRIYKDLDPRAKLIIDKLEEYKIGQEFPEIATVLGDSIELFIGKKLPLNIDGAIAVALCSFGWDPKLGKAVFIIARTPGLCGQYLENT